MRDTKALRIRKFGGPEMMAVREVPMVAPSKGQVLVQVAASGVNFIDLYVREGRYATPLPFVPGQAAAGTVVAIGEHVTTITIGERVAWCSVLGTYAQYALAPAESLVQIPQRSSSIADAICTASRARLLPFDERE